MKGRNPGTGKDADGPEDFLEEDQHDVVEELLDEDQQEIMGGTGQELVLWPWDLQ